MKKFKWPKPKKSNLVLKDLLETNVPEKYYLSKERLEAIANWNASTQPLKTMEIIAKNQFIPTLTTRDGDEHSDMKLIKEKIKKEKPFSSFEQENVVSSKEDETIPTLTSSGAFSRHKIIENIFESGHHGGRVYDPEKIAPTFKENHGNAIFINDLWDKYRIRKITPKESLRLMGLNDFQIDKIQESKLIPESKQYFIAGNSIVVQVLEAIFKQIDFPKDRPLKVFEAFAGYGSQAIALKNLGYEVHSQTSEWFVPAIISYALLHHNRAFKECIKNVNKMQPPREKIFEWFKDLTFSLDSKNPSKLNSLSNEDLIALYVANQLNENHGSILEAEPINMEWYDLLTYSFPCQDLSSAGKGKGMAKESGTRSGLLWEIERILLGFKKLNNLPKVLLMENVPKIHSKQNIDDFNKWIAVLKNLGYVSTYKDLNAKDFGIPQNRVRTYMVSILDGEVQNETTEQLTLF